MSATVLLVEDDQDLVFGVTMALEREGFRVVSANNGASGLHLAGQASPDIVVLDVGLPDMDGFEVCRQLRKSSGVPILFLSARVEEFDRVLGLELGADDYLTKPFSTRELCARVRALHRRSTGLLTTHEERRIAVHDLVILPERRKVLAAGREVHLTNTEFQMLMALVRRPGRVFTREELLDAVWEQEGQFLTDQVVNVHIRRLREKIEADPNQPMLIITVRGAGYKLLEVRR